MFHGRYSDSCKIKIHLTICSLTIYLYLEKLKSLITNDVKLKYMNYKTY